MAEPEVLEIVRLGAQADGVAETLAGPVFIAGSLPGELVTCEVADGRGRLVAIGKASPDRVTPPCPHFGTCGGCSAQHMSSPLYRAWKRDFVATAFRHRGLDVEISDMIAVGPGQRRRATFTARKTARGLVLGFHEEGSHALVDLAVCPVVTPAIAGALPGLRAIADVSIASGESIRLAVTDTPDGLDVSLTDLPRSPDASAKAVIADVARKTGIARVTASGEIVMQSLVPSIPLGSARVPLPPGAFIQATAAAEQAIAEILVEATGKAKRVADLFCGLGTFTFALARRARVFAADSERPAIEALQKAAKAAPGVKPIEARVRDLMREPLSRTELAGFDAVVLDPPRAGAKEQVEAIARSKVPIVGMVSCNPATMARDCRTLVDAGFEVDRLVPVDQFVWSTHVEAVAILKRSARK